MNCDWKTIGEKIFSFYEEMDYRPEYTVEQFKTDLETEEKRKLTYPELLRRNTNSNGENSNLYWILHFRKVLEGRRSILTKLFSLGSNFNGFDTLVEYCDYYTEYSIDEEVFSIVILRMMRSIYTYLAANRTVGFQLFHDVWSMLEKDFWRGTSVSLEYESNIYPDHRFGTAGIVIMADSDLNAAVQTLIRSRGSFFEVSRVLVQEPVKDILLNIISDHEYKTLILANLFVFRNVGEALVDLNSCKKIDSVSVWSENIIAAKKFARDVEINTIWINTHGELTPGLRSIILLSPSFKKCLYDSDRSNEEQGSSSETGPDVIRTVDLFYGGKWELPTKGEYSTDQSGVSFAQATENDFNKCATTARKAFKLWRSTKLSQRAKVIRCFAERLRAYGQLEYADLISRRANPQFLEHGNSLSIARDGEIEITTTSRPIGIIAIASNDQKKLFEKLTIAILAGNTVILGISIQNVEVSFVPYCEMFAACGFPPGVINCLFITNEQSRLELDETIADRVLGCATDNLDGFKLLQLVTKPKSVGLRCG